jgi:gluconolactonase
MTTLWRWAAALAVVTLGTGLAHAQTPSKPAVERLDPALDALIDPNAKLELVKTGYGFTEGMVWVPEGNSGYLLLSDMPANIIYKLDPHSGKQSIWLDHSGYTKPDIWRVGFEQTNGKDPKDPAFEKFYMIGSNGLTLDRQGRVIICTWAGRSMDRIEKDGKRTTLTDNWNGQRFNGTNDVAVKKDGAIYFTDGYGGLRGRDQDPGKGLPFNAVLMWKNGKTTLLIKDIENTNGLAFSPDEKFLYVNGGRDKFVKRYPVLADDTLGQGEMLIDLKPQSPTQITDGMKVDTKGNIWESGGGEPYKGGIWIITPEGKHVGSIAVPEAVANVEWGEPDHKTLYIVARTSVYKIKTKVVGIP